METLKSNSCVCLQIHVQSCVLTIAYVHKPYCHGSINTGNGMDHVSVACLHNNYVYMIFIKMI